MYDKSEQVLAAIQADMTEIDFEGSTTNIIAQSENKFAKTKPLAKPRRSTPSKPVDTATTTSAASSGATMASGGTTMTSGGGTTTTGGSY